MPIAPFRRAMLTLSVLAALAGCATVPAAPAAKPSAPAPAAQAAPQPEEAVEETADSAPAPTAEAEPANNYPKQPLTPELLYKILVGDLAHQRGQGGLAVQAWLEVAKQSGDPRAARRAMEVAYGAGQMELAIEAAKLWRDTDQAAGLLPRQTMLTLLLRAKRTDEAVAELLAVLNAKPDDTPSLLLQLHTLWNNHVDAKEALRLTQLVAGHYPQHPESQLAIALSAQSAGQNEVALAAVDRALAMKPDWESAIVYRARLLDSKTGTAALDYLRATSKSQPGLKEVRTALARELVEAKQYIEARDVFAALGRTDPTEIEYAVGEALAAMQGRDYPGAERAFQRALTLNPKQPAVLHYYLGIAAEEQWRMEDAIKYYAQVEDGEYAAQANTRLARAYAKLGRRDEAFATSAQLPVHTEADQIAKVQVEAQVFRELRELDRARATLDEGLTRFADNPELLYDRSLILEMQGRIEEAERDLRRYIERNPDNALGLNALGYTLANRTQRFDEAEKLIRQALEREPENPVILDSMGWLEFRRGNINEAIKWLGRAFAAMPDPEIAAHYGEALWHANRRSEARKIWAAGSKLDPRHEVLAETMQRLTKQ
ncbi:tetratricopeptide repeat protein [Chitinimonas lacunae]|uniref:Tetratricopeptide repeat protein n=1 Tax=Chitinimonas lacunae TaxID=1963018 RepID=A0ABV8MSE7_9NEIS